MSAQGGQASVDGVEVSLKLVPDDCTSKDVGPFQLELSNKDGDFSNPIVLAEGGILEIGSILHHRIRPYSFPIDLPPGTNYFLRIRVKGSTVTGAPQGPLTVLALDNTSIATLVVNEVTCPIQVQGQAVGSNMILTGPNGYVFSYVFRDEQRAALSFPVDKPGTYLLKNTTITSICPAFQSVTVSKSCP